ncbi:NKAP domain containing 1 [Solea solea]|uniref:NKAP domain containing 1 n=1 Tax=Solea solea TaxID=90069 RepID=UPI00272A5BD3|nr:NKAP domain containing 1 [Solea solea]
MSKQTLGKVLLKNVIRHTDAHNKIQEEMEMWKMRGWETRSDTGGVRGHMHCDRIPDQTSRSRGRVSEHDDREARIWTRKLYEFEANDPDRWGHSGFKELYPDEFESDGEKQGATKNLGHHKRKKSKSDTKASISKHSKKSSRKKKKKKKKKDEGVKHKKAKCLSSDDSSEDSSDDSSEDGGAAKDKQGRKSTKSQHKDKKSAKTRGRDRDSSSGDSDGGDRKRRARKKQKRDSLNKDSASGRNLKKKRRKNWRGAGEESSDDSCAE